MKAWILVLIVVTVGAIFYLNRSYASYYDSFDINYIPVPNYSTNQSINNNSDQTIKLVVLGDSLMAGLGSSDEEHTLAYLIADGFSENVELVNVAVSGAAVSDVYENQLTLGIKEKPDMVILFIGTNDVHNARTTEEFKKIYQQILQGLVDAKIPKIVLINIPYIGSSQILSKPWNEVLVLRTTQFNSIIDQLAKNYNFKVIDLYASTKDQFKNPSPLYSKDQFHPSDLGYQKWSEIITDSLKSQN